MEKRAVIDLGECGVFGTFAEGDPKGALQETLDALEGIGKLLGDDGLPVELVPQSTLSDVGKAVKILAGVGTGLASQLENKRQASLIREAV